MSSEAITVKAHVVVCYVVVLSTHFNHVTVLLLLSLFHFNKDLC